MKPGVGTNRFSYALNDPVNLSDQNGNIVPLLVAAAIAYVGSYEYANAPTLDSGSHSRSGMDMASTMVGGAAVGRAAWGGASWAGREAGLFIGSRLPSTTIFGLELGLAEATGMTAGVGLAAKGTGLVAGQVGTARELLELRKRSGVKDAFDIDHIPSRAALIKNAENAAGGPLEESVKRQISNEGTAVAIPRNIHQGNSSTFGGRNNQTKIAGDAGNLSAAVTRDINAYRSTLGNTMMDQIENAIRARSGGRY
jgi:hypothetical protein